MSSILMYYKALARRVIAVAVVNEEIGDWTAYIDAVPGMNHTDEFADVARTGSKLDQKVAEYYFGHLADKYRWRN